ncbi:hypothetical protein PM082_005353 [Marasmius tenuissimus]|nr:hypothetical protein PM082_005353 [Marasmius tenuissimus]
MDKLPKIPKLNKDHFISSFIASQKANAKVYAEEGKAVTLAWRGDQPNESSASATHPESNAHEQLRFGFGTPVLKPRKPSTVQPSVKKTTKHAPSAAPPQPPDSQKSKKNTRSSGALRKRQETSDEDDEKLARLAERRTRKRAKREIVRPKSPVDEQSEPRHGEKPRKPKGDGKSKRASSGPTGLALLHGFSAPNVCKNRLTLNPNKFGVFNQGRASSKVHVQRGKKKTTGQNVDLVFSELNFLNRTRKLATNADNTPSVHVLSNSECSGDEETDPAIENTGTETRSEKSADEDSIASNHTKKSTAKPAESEVWDIEREGFELKSAVSEPTRDRNIDTRMSVWTKQLRQDDMSPPDGASATVLSAGDRRRPSSSIAPSQSASQVLLLRKTRSLTTSRFFSSRPVKADEHLEPPVPEAERHPIPPSPNERHTQRSHTDLTGSPIKSIPFSGAHPRSPGVDVEASPQVECLPPVDKEEQPYELYEPQRAMTPYFSDVDLSYLGCMDQGGYYFDVDVAIAGDMHYIDSIDTFPLFKSQGIEQPGDDLYSYLSDGCFGVDSHIMEDETPYGAWSEEEGEPHGWTVYSEDLGYENLQEPDRYEVEEGDEWMEEVEEVENNDLSGPLENCSGYQSGLYQGRELLLGLFEGRDLTETDTLAVGVGLSAAEADVVVNMRGQYWWPQKL